MSVENTVSSFSLSSSSSAPNGANQTSSSSASVSQIAASPYTAGTSTWRPPAHWNVDSSASSAGSSTIKKPPRKKLRTEEEIQVIAETSARVASRIAADQSAVLNPDIETPFLDAIDVMNRLLPYHIFLQPKEDLAPLLCDRKGKAKAINVDEINDTKFALECHRRRKKLQERLRKARVKGGDGSEFNAQLVTLTQSVLEADRAEVAALNAELRLSRSEFDRLERQKRASSNPPVAAVTTMASQPYYAHQPQPVVSTAQSAYYRPYPFAFAQPYVGAATPVPNSSTPAFSVAPTTTTTPVPPQTSIPAPSNPPPTPTTTSAYQPGSAIPVQLPVASMPALNRLGIVPVPAASLPNDGTPPPPAVLRGSSANGATLNLEINVSLLQSAQMSGLALILNSLMSRTSTAVATPSTSTPAPSSAHVFPSTPSTPVATSLPAPLPGPENTA